VILIRERVEKSEKNRRRSSPPVVDEHNPVMEMTLSVKTVLKDLNLAKYMEIFDSEEVSFLGMFFLFLTRLKVKVNYNFFLPTDKFICTFYAVRC
jgi:hypothetical protein